MSKLHYLMVILVLCVVGYVSIWQFRLATQSALQLTGEEIIKGIELRLLAVTKQLKRCPDSDREFYVMVLAKVEFPAHSPQVSIGFFRPGSAVAPAMFQITITTPTIGTPQAYPMLYYGCDYQANLALKGKLLRLH